MTSEAGAGENVTNEALRRRWRPRRDGVALGFGVAFIAFGVLGLLRAGGVHVDSVWLCSAIAIGLGLAGLVSVALRERG